MVWCYFLPMFSANAWVHMVNHKHCRQLRLMPGKLGRRFLSFKSLGNARRHLFCEIFLPLWDVMSTSTIPGLPILGDPLPEAFGVWRCAAGVYSIKTRRQCLLKAFAKCLGLLFLCQDQPGKAQNAPGNTIMLAWWCRDESEVAVTCSLLLLSLLIITYPGTETMQCTETEVK